MNYIEINNWKEYEKKKEWLKAIELLQDEIAYNLITVYNMYSEEKIDIENSSRIYSACDYSIFENNFKNSSKDKMCYISKKLNLWRIEYECCVENEEGLYNSEDLISCFKASLDIQKKLKNYLKRC